MAYAIIAGPWIFEAEPSHLLFPVARSAEALKNGRQPAQFMRRHHAIRA